MLNVRTSQTTSFRSKSSASLQLCLCGLCWQPQAAVDTGADHAMACFCVAHAVLMTLKHICQTIPWFYADILSGMALHFVGQRWECLQVISDYWSLPAGHQWSLIRSTRQPKPSWQRSGCALLSPRPISACSCKIFDLRGIASLHKNLWSWRSLDHGGILSQCFCCCFLKSRKCIWRNEEQLFIFCRCSGWLMRNKHHAGESNLH